METAVTESKALTVKTLFGKDEVRTKFQELLGKKAQGFITSVLQVVSQNSMLQKADPHSVYHAAAVAAVLDLPINPNLGFAYIVPYNQSYVDGQDEKGKDIWKKKQVAQFQMGYKGFKQLALRSGQFRLLHATDVREGELIKYDRLTGYMEFKWVEVEAERLKKKIVGYVSYFELLNGFSQTFYMTVEKLEIHGKKYSQTYKNDKGLWKDDFESMCMKTVTKLNLSKNAPLSIEMQKAVVVDQAVINDSEALDVTYADNESKQIEPELVDKETERIALMIGEAASIQDLNKILPHVKAEQMDLFNQKLNELKK